MTKDRGVDVVVMCSPLLDTRRAKETNGSLVADVVAEVLSYAANDVQERKHRIQKAVIERAKERGVHCGRVAKPLPENFESVYEQWKNGEITGAEAAKNAICLYLRFAIAQPGFEEYEKRGKVKRHGAAGHRAEQNITDHKVG